MVELGTGAVMMIGCGSESKASGSVGKSECFSRFPGVDVYLHLPFIPLVLIP